MREEVKERKVYMISSAQIYTIVGTVSLFKQVNKKPKPVVYLQLKSWSSQSHPKWVWLKIKTPSKPTTFSILLHNNSLRYHCEIVLS